MKYYLISYLWRAKGSEKFSSGNGYISAVDMVELYEGFYEDAEYGHEKVLTHVVEISEEEYTRAFKNGILG
jgi:hypothetical protein